MLHRDELLVKLFFLAYAHLSMSVSFEHESDFRKNKKM